MTTLKGFLKNRKMEIYAQKTKVLIFNSTGKSDKRKWKWESKEIEEMKSFKHLGFTFK